MSWTQNPNDPPQDALRFRGTYYFGQFSIRADMMAGLERYVNDGVPTGDFLRAVITNNLRKAVEHADHQNMANLPAFVGYLYNEAPATCWGSEAIYDAWIASGGKTGISKESERVRNTEPSHG